jgi:hypothetical protein
MLQTWYDTESPGWVRMIFDDQKIPYTLIMDEDVRKGGLRARFDVILFASTGSSLKGIIGGYDTKDSPLDFTRSAAFPTLGTPTSSPDITGGLTFAGVGQLESFVRQGGVLVTLGGATTLPFEAGMVRTVSEASSDGVYCPGSELRARFRRPDHPLAYGYPEITSVFREDWTLFKVRRVDEGSVVLQWGTKIPKEDDDSDDDKKDDDKDADKSDKKDSDKKDEALVVSGGVTGDSKITGRPAILDLPLGTGRILAFNFDPIHRYQTESDFRLVWNAILNWNDLPPVPAAK